MVSVGRSANRSRSGCVAYSTQHSIEAAFPQKREDDGMWREEPSSASATCVLRCCYFSPLPFVVVVVLR